MTVETVTVITCDSRCIVGTLKGVDQMTNVILEGCHERSYSQESGVELEALGLYIIRGETILLVHTRQLTLTNMKPMSL